jgi:voltage-gated potassium channel
MKSIKKRLFEIIQTANEHDVASKIFDVSIICLIILNVVLVIADTFNLPSAVSSAFNVIEVISVIIFTIEYLCRFWTSDLLYPEMKPIKARIKYIFSFMALIDLFAILPFYIPFIIKIDLRVLRMLRIIRLLRVFKINRYTTALSAIGTVFKKKKNQLISSIFVVLLLMVIASVLMYNVEHDAQPEAFGNAFSALWWAVATFTTVGYGDIYPVTVLGKILSAIIAMLGIGLVAVPTGIISAGFIENIDHPEEDDEKHYCPYCGKKIK